MLPLPPQPPLPLLLVLLQLMLLAAVLLLLLSFIFVQSLMSASSLRQKTGCPKVASGIAQQGARQTNALLAANEAMSRAAASQSTVTAGPVRHCHNVRDLFEP
jgi:hypothetical protein